MRRRGITLVEIVVASFVMSILLVVVAKVFVPAMNAWTDGQRRSEVGQSLLVTTAWIGDDVTRSSPDSLEISEDLIFGMRCALGRRENEENEFKQVVAYYVKDKTLFRADKTMEGGGGVPALTLADLGDFDSTRKVGSGVKLCKIRVVNPWRMEVHLVMEKDDRSAEIRTGYSSMYAPFDPNTQQQQVDSEADEDEEELPPKDEDGFVTLYVAEED